jgi:hypothetical protein
MPESSRLTAHRERASTAEEIPAIDPADDGECECEDKTNCTCKKEDNMTDKPKADAADKPVLAAVEAIAAPLTVAGYSSPDFNARMKAVAADDRTKGREAQALAMLGDSDFDSLSAAAICKTLATMPITTAPAADNDGARMLAAIESGANNPDLGNESAALPTDKAVAAAGWAKAAADVNRMAGHA